MKKIINICLAVAFSFAMLSCEVEEQHSVNQRVTYYPAFTIVDGTPYIVAVGTSWTDPGCTAVVDGVDVSSKIVTSGEVDSDKMGVYTVTYSYVNIDGFTSQTTRTVYVCNPEITARIDGTYTTITGTQRTSYKDDGSVNNETPYSGFPIKVAYVCPGFFTISDALGAYYEEYVGYGAKYNYEFDFSPEVSVSLNDDNTLDYVSGGFVAAWGDEISSFSNAVYDPDASTITFDTEYAGMLFHVVMKK